MIYVREDWPHLTILQEVPYNGWQLSLFREDREAGNYYLVNRRWISAETALRCRDHYGFCVPDRQHEGARALNVDYAALGEDIQYYLITRAGIAMSLGAIHDVLRGMDWYLLRGREATEDAERPTD